MSKYSLSNISEGLLNKFIDFSPKIVMSLIVLIVGFWAVGRVLKIMDRLIERSNSSKELKPFLKSLINILLKILVIFSSAAIVGIETSSFVAVLAAMGFAIGMALQGSLGNLAAGVMILIFKPYKVGDVIDIKSFKGSVDAIDIFNTVLIGYDNRKIIIPNGVAISDVIVNMTARETRRIDITLTIPYQEDFVVIKELLLSTVSSIENVHNEPAPFVGILSFDSHNISIAVRMHSDAANHWTIYFEAMEKIKRALSDNNIPVAYPEGIELGKIG